MKLLNPRRHLFFVAPILLFMFITGCGDGSDSISCDYRATIAESRVAIQEALEESGGASMSVALTDDRGIIWNEAFGIADTASGDAPTLAAGKHRRNRCAGPRRRHRWRN